MDASRLQKIFGVGPTGAGISLLFFGLFTWADGLMGRPAIMTHAAPLKALGAACVILGLGLHFWAFSTLRNWWNNDTLCTKGPFRYFRHPMYAAWITFVFSGVALYLNSWMYLLWVLSLHPIWHRLVRKEETTMLITFGDTYEDYARRTGRFIPRISHRHPVG
ncbi:MAG: isoprenylcysteine carboxylmethyltransferase family protein [Deltaproteobacteria bacterium]|nr:isoprenylcysteine carboxylmethyltransferase family protein [Deltaproteobacteria bacterium]